MRKVAGIDNVGLGGDYDGTTELPTGMEDVAGYPLLFAELIRRGWTDAELTKLATALAAHDKRYYQADAPTVSDAAYDALRVRASAIAVPTPARSKRTGCLAACSA